MKMLSIPKLELQAVLLAARLKDDIEKGLTLYIPKMLMWTDSTTVLQWLNSTSKQPVFVANPVGEILESKSVGKFFHVLSGDNPADTRTRDVTPDSLKQSHSAWPFNQLREGTKNGAPGWSGLRSE